jgi:hypothetical protein
MQCQLKNLTDSFIDGLPTGTGISLDILLEDRQVSAITSATPGAASVSQPSRVPIVDVARKKAAVAGDDDSDDDIKDQRNQMGRRLGDVMAHQIV